ncbi:RNA recognition motif-containing protein [Cryptosporidium felis]|nr:RNA recognition motif-containing protein [Cryptosporidium felis]
MVFSITEIISKQNGSQGRPKKVNSVIEEALSECTNEPFFSENKKKAVKELEEKLVKRPRRQLGKNKKEDNIGKAVYDKNNDPRIDNTLFVGNVSLHISEKDLLKKLEIKRSQIESLRFRSLPIHPKFSSKKKVGAALECFSGNSSTKNAYIVLKDKEQMKSIIEKFSGATLAGNSLRLTPASKGNQFSTFDRKRTVFVGGLPRFCTEDELRKFVAISLNEDCVDSVRVIKSSTTGKPKGFGFVLFKDRKYVILAVKNMNGALFRDSKISVTKALSEDEAKNKSKSENSGVVIKGKKKVFAKGSTQEGKKNLSKKKLNKVKKLKSKLKRTAESKKAKLRKRIK